MMLTEAQKRAKKAYDKKTRQFVFRFRNEADADVISRLSKVPSKTDYVRGLVREDIAKSPDADWPSESH
jgi:hypothetical protein